MTSKAIDGSLGMTILSTLPTISKRFG